MVEEAAIVPDAKTDWMIRTRRLLLQEQVEDDDDSGINVSIITVPKNLIMSPYNSQLYKPQLVSMGPYHCQHPELQDFERYKLSAAKRIKKRLHAVKFMDLVHDFIQSEHKVRAHYHRYLDFNSDTLAWMMAIDASFLLDFLQIHTDSRRLSTHNVILRDLIMAENQIPLFLLIKIIRAQYSSKEEADEKLSRIVIGFLEDICPFKMQTFQYIDDISRHSHLLDLLYKVVVPDDHDRETCIHLEEATLSHDDDDDVDAYDDNGDQRIRRTRSVAVVEYFLNLSIYIANSLMHCIKYVVITVCLKTIANLPIFLMLKWVLFRGRNSNEESTLVVDDHEERSIPSVTELINAGVKFTPTYINNEAMTTISFDTNKGIFQLPRISLDPNTEAVLRNLVAYEVLIIDGPWKLTRYTELMSGIIDTKDDVRLLREKGVVANYMRSDKDAADMWNGMSGTMNQLKLDRVVEDVNCYMNRKWRIRITSLMRRNGLDSWHLPSFFFAFLFFLFLGMNSLCLLFRCSR